MTPLLLGLAVAANAAPGTLARDDADFAFALHRRLDPKGNLFYSPYSLSSALAMVYAGAGGDTAAEMAKALHLSLPPAELHAAFKAENEALNAAGAAGKVKLTVANALWGEQSFPFKKAFTDLCARAYGGGLSQVDFKHAAAAAARTIDTWVADKTAGRIKDIIPPAVLTADTRLVLTNAIYFKGNWDRQFKKGRTRIQPFMKADGAKVDASLMQQNGRFLYAELPGLQALEMLYEGRGLSMLVLLPTRPAGLPSLEDELSAEALERWTGLLKEQEVEVYFPRFKLEAAFEARMALRALGMKAAFDPARANFAGMSDAEGLYIRAVLHKAFVAVDETGTEAAAATGVVMHSKRVAQRMAVFRADHPFIFLIRDAGGHILFLGRLAEPKD